MTQDGASDDDVIVTYGKSVLPLRHEIWSVEMTILAGRRAAHDPNNELRIGLAVSGGGDSMALMALAQENAQGRESKRTYRVATVDHGLRPEAATEAAGVAAVAAKMGFAHDTLLWQDWDGQGNLQGQARNARYSLLAQWAKDHGLTTVYVAHTRDDDAESILMALARGTGLDGLTGMRAGFYHDDVWFIRPLLGRGRDELRDYLRKRDLAWVEDPSNSDDRFERVRVRKAMEVLSPLGITAEGLMRTAENLKSSRDGYAQIIRAFTERHVTEGAGALSVQYRPFAAMGPEFQRRFLTRALQWVSGDSSAPRAEAVARLTTRDGGLEGGTLHGCLVSVWDKELWITGQPAAELDAQSGVVIIEREPGRVPASDAPTSDIWDRRWRISGPHAEGLTVRPLGDTGREFLSFLDPEALGIDLFAFKENMAAAGHRLFVPASEAALGEHLNRFPGKSLRSSPAIWQGDTLIAAPLAGFNPDWSARIVADFKTFLLSH